MVKSRGRPKKAAAPASVPTKTQNEDDGLQANPPKRRGRPPKNTQPAAATEAVAVAEVVAKEAEQSVTTRASAPAVKGRSRPERPSSDDAGIPVVGLETPGTSVIEPKKIENQAPAEQDTSISTPLPPRAHPKETTPPLDPLAPDPPRREKRQKVKSPPLSEDGKFPPPPDRSRTAPLSNLTRPEILLREMKAVWLGVSRQRYRSLDLLREARQADVPIEPRSSFLTWLWIGYRSHRASCLRFTVVWEYFARAFRYPADGVDDFVSRYGSAYPQIKDLKVSFARLVAQAEVNYPAAVSAFEAFKPQANTPELKEALARSAAAMVHALSSLSCLLSLLQPLHTDSIRQKFRRFSGSEDLQTRRASSFGKKADNGSC